MKTRRWNVVMFVAICALTSFLGLRAANARVGEQLTGFGLAMMHWSDTQLNGKPRRLLVNGIEVRLTTASTPLAVGVALERVRAFCRARSGVEHAVDRLDRPSSRRGAPGTPTPLPSYSWGTDAKGIVACLDTGAALTLGELGERAQRFADTGDLAALGQLRFVVARRDGATTTLLVMWTDGPIPIRAAFPSSGDASGQDPSGVPRPPSGRRVLSAVEAGEPYSVTSYEVRGRAASDLVSWYRAALSKRGFTVTPSADALVARRGDRTLVVRALPRRDRTTVSVVELD